MTLPDEVLFCPPNDDELEFLAREHLAEVMREEERIFGKKHNLNKYGIDGNFPTIPDLAGEFAKGRRFVSRSTTV